MKRWWPISKATKTRRAEKAKKLLTNIRHPSVPNQLGFFSDGTNFINDQNRRNNW
jgi:hypothetical protein